MSTPAVEVSDLWLAYPGAETAALRGVSLSVAPGEMLAVAGPSGAGKSTLCACLKGLVPHTIVAETRGCVTVLGNVVTGDGPRVADSRVSLVLQDPEAQIIGMTIEDDLAFAPENYGVPAAEIRSRIKETLSLVGLSGRESLDTYALSGGQKQRLAIAAALMMKPDVLILDEPTSELDPEGKEQVFAIIDRLRSDSGATIIIVEHDISRLASKADKLLVLDHGTVAAFGRPADLLTDIELFERTGGERPPAAAELPARLHRAHLVRLAAYGLDLDIALTAIEQDLKELAGDL